MRDISLSQWESDNSEENQENRWYTKPVSEETESLSLRPAHSIFIKKKPKKKKPSKSNTNALQKVRFI